MTHHVGFYDAVVKLNRQGHKVRAQRLARLTMIGGEVRSIAVYKKEQEGKLGTVCSKSNLAKKNQVIHHAHYYEHGNR